MESLVVIIDLCGRRLGFAIVRDILVDEEHGFWDRRRVLQNTKLLYIRAREELRVKYEFMATRNRNVFDNSLRKCVELSTDRLHAFSNAYGVMEDGVLGVHVICTLHIQTNWG